MTTAAEIAASLIRTGEVEPAAFHMAAARTGKTYAEVRDEYKRRQSRPVTKFHFRQRDEERERRELEAWASGATATEAERAYYGRGRL
jgi:hypothetical protein